MTTLENLPAELLAEIALMCRHPAYIVKLMLVSKTMYENLSQEHTCVSALKNSHKFRDVTKEIKELILYFDIRRMSHTEHTAVSQITYSKNVKALECAKNGHLNKNINFSFVYILDKSNNLSTNKYIYSQNIIGWLTTTKDIIEEFDGDYKITRIRHINWN
jgi:hypothetical protein